MVHTAEIALGSIAQRLRPQIDAALRQYIDLPDGCPAPLREAMAYSVLTPGKRLRPMLVLLAAEGCGGSVEDALPPACAVEMIHAYSLVHDDLPAMDDDDLRRGRPTCHKKFGEAMAILAGDALLTLAFEVVAKNVHPPDLAADCCGELATAAGACHMVGGQADDISGSGLRFQGSEVLGPNSRLLTLLESIHRRKTGAMINVSLRLGAIVAGAVAEQLEALDRYGRALGLAFQITDDLLDVRGSEDAAGKRLKKDSERGKLTFPACLGVEESLRRAEQLVTDACGALVPLGPAAAGLDAVARYVLERNR